MGAPSFSPMYKLVLYAAVFGAVTATVFATTCSQTGTSYSYAESVSSTTRTITTNHCPNHPYFNTNPNYAVSTSTTITVPAKPQLKGSSAASDTGALDQTPTTGEGSAEAALGAQGGSMGVFFSGAMLYSPYGGPSYGTTTGFTTSATYAEGNTFDQCGGHSSSTSSASYHVHVPPSCLMYQLGGWAIDSSAHSPQLGWAADGFPVYGPHGPSGTRMQTCSITGGTYGTASCTDNCGGMYKVDSSIDDFYYRYYIQGTYNDGKQCTSPSCPSLGEAYYPNTPMCFRGCCPFGITCSYGNIIGSCSGTYSNGYSSSYTPSATSSNGAGGSGTDMSSGLAINSCACACDSLACETSTCSEQAWKSTQCNAYTNSCPTTAAPSSSDQCASPTNSPTNSPTKTPTSPTNAPTNAPTKTPTSPTSAPTNAPTVTPTTAPTMAYAANFEVAIVGLASSDFDSTAQSSFKGVVSANAGSNCGSSGTSVCTSDDITIASYQRRTISVVFTVGMYSSDSADTAVSTLSSYMSSATFATDLVATGGGLASVSSTSVTSASTSNNNSDGSSDTTTIIIVVCVVGAVVLLAGAGAVYYFTQGNKSEKLVETTNVEMSSGQPQASAVQHQQAPDLARDTSQNHLNPGLL